MADRSASRGMRDEAGVGPNPRNTRRLVPLKDVDDYKVADGEPDIRGWKVFTATGRELGDIDDLLIDTDIGEVVMLDIDLKRNDRRTLAPIKAAWIDRGSRRVVLNTSMFEADEDIPALHRSDEPLESESVRRFNERYERAYGADGWDRDRDITVRRANDDIRISRSVPPPVVADRSSAEAPDARRADVPVERAPSRAADTVDRAGDAVERGAERTADALRGEPQEEAQRERRRFVRYGPSRENVPVEEVVARRRVLDGDDLSPSETERLRQQSGDLTTDARDTLVNPPPTEERR